MPWRELERRLSGRPGRDRRRLRRATAATPPPGRASAPPTRPRRCAGRRARRSPFAELHAHSSFSFLDGASSPEELAEEAVRLGLRVADPHRPRRRLRRRPLRRGGRGARPGHRVRRRAVARRRRCRARPAERADRRPGRRPRPARHPPARPGPRPRRATPGCRRAIGTAHLRGGAKGRPVYDDLEELAAAADGHWLVLTGCRKGAVRRALDRGGDRPRPGRALDELVDAVRPRQRRRRAHPRARPARRRALRGAGRAGRRVRAAARRHHRRALPRAAAPAARHGDWPRCAPAAASTRSTAGCRPGPGSTCAAATRWPPASPAGPARSPNAARLAQGDRLPAAAHRPGPAAVPVPRRAHRDDATCASSPTRRGAAASAASRTRPRRTR